MFLFMGTLAAQEKHKERIKSLKIAYITEKLALTSEEAQTFWPIYNLHEEKIFQLRNVDFRKIKNNLRDKGVNNISNEEASKILNAIEKIEYEMYYEKKELTKKLRKVLPSKKIITLKKVEDDFNRELIKRLRERRGERINRRN